MTITEIIDHTVASPTGRRRVTLFVIAELSTADFDRMPMIATGVYPSLLDADNLRSAALSASRLDNDECGNRPLPLLRIRATASAGSGDRLEVRDSIEFARSPRLLAGLIADAVRAGVAAGAVVSALAPALELVELREELTAYLEHADFDVAFDVPGWVFAGSGQRL